MCYCTVFALFYFGLIESNFRVEAPGRNSSEVLLHYEFGGLIFGEVYTWRFIRGGAGGKLIGGFFALRVWGAYIWRGLYMEDLIFWNFMEFNINMTYQCYSQNKGKELNRGSTDWYMINIYFPWRVLVDFLNEAENKIILHQSSLL